MRTLLIDADTLVYEAAIAAEVPIQWDANLWTLHALFEPARAQLDGTVQELKEKLAAGDAVMALSDYGEPWRKKIMPTYKANRKATRKPIIFEPLREYVHEVYRTYQKPGLEGDDVLGILLTHPALISGEKVVCSIDKDMSTLPGLHANITQVKANDTAQVREVTLDQANYYHLRQTLTGDSTDGYPGCPGVGPKGADKILECFIDDAGEFDVCMAWEEGVVPAYRKAKLSEEVALVNARVARIARTEDYDFKNKAVVLWNVPRN